MLTEDAALLRLPEPRLGEPEAGDPWELWGRARPNSGGSASWAEVVGIPAAVDGLADARLEGLLAGLVSNLGYG